MTTYSTDSSTSIQVETLSDLRAGRDLHISDVHVTIIQDNSAHKSSPKLDLLPDRIRSAKTNHLIQESQLDAIKIALEAGSHVAVISGMSGTGKTEFAIEYLLQYKDIYLGGAIWSSYEDFRSNIGVLRTYSETNSKARVLWIVDDVPNPDSCIDQIKAVQSQLFVELHVLITTQIRLEPSQTIFRLAPFSIENSTAFFKEVLGIANSDIHEHEAMELCMLLGNQPLAIYAAANFLKNHPNVSLSQYLHQWCEKKLDHPSMESVVLHLDHAWEILCGQKEEFTPLFAYLFALFQLNEIRIGWIWDMVNELTHLKEFSNFRSIPKMVNTAYEQLHSIYFLEKLYRDSEQFLINPLARIYIHSKLEKFSRVQAVKKAGANCLLKAADELWNQNQRTPAKPLYDEAFRLMEEWLGDDIQAISTKLTRFSKFYSFWWPNQQNAHSQVSTLSQEQLTELEHLASTLATLANTARDQGGRKLKQAESLYLQALAAYQELNTSPSSMHQVLHDLSRLYIQQKRYSEAELILFRLLHPNSSENANILTELADLYRLPNFDHHYLPYRFDRDNTLWIINSSDSSVILDRDFSKSLKLSMEVSRQSINWFLKRCGVGIQTIKNSDYQGLSLWEKALNAIAVSIDVGYSLLKESPKLPLLAVALCTLSIAVPFSVGFMLGGSSNRLVSKSSAGALKPATDANSTSQSPQGSRTGLASQRCGDTVGQAVEGLPEIVLWRPVFVTQQRMNQIGEDFCIEDRQPNTQPINGQIQLASFGSLNRAIAFANNHQACVGSPNVRPLAQKILDDPQQYDRKAGRFLISDFDRALVEQAYARAEQAATHDEAAFSQQDDSPMVAIEHWQAAVTLWQESIALLQSISPGSIYTENANEAIAKYTSYLASAQENINHLRQSQSQSGSANLISGNSPLCDV
ncbi:hypothetical protein ACQ4M4_08585 [Leptolyngbya sp. AN02str]|uniref:hypothetical protein n=1 Tax=Leptolyngbya sp. AN02str TaxID=3423363 RepID=UPI003D322F8A